MMTSAAVLSDSSRRLSYLTVFLPAIKYAAPVLTLNIKESRAIMKKASPIYLNSCGLSRITNFNIAHGPLCYAGINSFDLHAFYTARSTKWIIQNIGSNDTTENLFKINLSHHQMEMGSEMGIFDLDVQKCKYSYSETYITKLWKNLAICSSKLQLHCKPEIVIAREGEKFIMDIATSIGISKKQLQNINETSKHLKILLLPDIVTLNGKSLKKDI